jgi:prepilin-type N-terminal cleavage/methylation domain-containing protein
MAAHRVNTEQGFTLIEVMIAILLSAIAVVGLVGIYSVQTRGSSVSRHTTEAAVLAEDRMETLRTQTAPATGSETGLDAIGAAGGIYNRAWTVAIGGADITYSVTVSWNEDGITRNVTLRSKRGL